MAAAGLALIGLAGCAETEFAAQTTKELTRAERPRGVKIGQPYQINGVWYKPRADDRYVEEGEASWYGRKFHGRQTANGETFNMNDLTAAHPTLPLPSIVRVTNLENGRSLELRVNDRGPFADGRIIDVSRRAAELLGFRTQGVAQVRVEILPEKSLIAQGLTPEEMRDRAAAADAREPAPTILIAAATPPPASDPDRADTDDVTWIQAGAFSAYPFAERARTRLHTVGPVVISTVTRGDAELYRVRVGPVAGDGEAQRMLAEMVRAGYPESRIVAD